ncbi:MAG TPA: MlaD family protein [Patescibacteria group bacterium]|nr:MlaD family protein [Patescibacteria group bacterium]
MEKNAPYFWVGLFVSLSLLATLCFFVWLVGPRDQKDYKFYTVEFHDSISGLEEGATVQYKGVKVGKVTALRLVKDNPELVHVDIGVDKSTPIKAHTKVDMAIQGVTGLVRLELSTAADDSEEPPKTENMPYPVLAGNASKLYQALEDIPAITEKIVAITTKFDTMLDNKTMASVQGAMANLENLSRDLNGVLSPANVSNLSMLLNNLNASSAQMPGLIANMNSTVDNLDAAAGTFSGILRRNQPHIDHFASEGLEQFTAASRATRGTANSVRKLADKLDRDPSQVIYQPSSRGVEIPK